MSDEIKSKNMKILIVEDEELAVKKIRKTLHEVDEKAEVVGVSDSITGTIDWLQTNPSPDLILMDIELSDGQSFEIFNRIPVKSAVVFTTSYDEYALKAFKVNSIDYLLKPIQKDELEAALGKYKDLKEIYNNGSSENPGLNMDALVRELQ